LRRKVIVIGLDGLEPGIVEAMLERGELPNLARIRGMVSFRLMAAMAWGIVSSPD